MEHLYLDAASTEPVGGDNQVEFTTRAVREGDGGEGMAVKGWR